MDLSPLRISLEVALTAAAVVLVIGTLIAWRLALSRFRGKVVVEAVLALPLVLPPTVVGYYLLAILGRGTAWGAWLNDSAGVRLLFTWQGAVVAASVMSMPLMVRTAAASIESVEPDLIESARTMGAGEWSVLWHVLLPMSYRGIVAGLVLAFGRALGEFGATLMVAGNIPGQTQTLPLALYFAVQEGDNRSAFAYAALLTLVSFVVLCAVGVYVQSRSGVLFPVVRSRDGGRERRG